MANYKLVSVQLENSWWLQNNTVNDAMSITTNCVMMIMMMNCFWGMVHQRKVFSLISSWDHCQRSSPSWISDMPQAGFEPVQGLSSGLVEWSCAAVISDNHYTITPPPPLDWGNQTFLTKVWMPQVRGGEMFFR